MKQNRIRLTESQLHKVIKESVNRILNEIGGTPKGQESLGALASARFQGKRKGDWNEPALKASRESDKVCSHGKRSKYSPAEMFDGYNKGWQSQVTKESRLNEGGYHEPWWDSDHQMWHDNDGTCDYVDFDFMEDDELMQMYQDTLEWFNHVPRGKWAHHSPDKYAKYKALQQELKERGII